MFNKVIKKIRLKQAEISKNTFLKTYWFFLSFSLFASSGNHFFEMTTQLKMPSMIVRFGCMNLLQQISNHFCFPMPIELFIFSFLIPIESLFFGFRIPINLLVFRYFYSIKHFSNADWTTYSLILKPWINYYYSFFFV